MNPNFLLLLATTVLSQVGGLNVKHRKLRESSATSEGKFIEGSYIVVFNDDIVSEDALGSRADRWTIGTSSIVRSVFKAAIQGVAMNNVDDDLLVTILNDPFVKYVEQEQEYELDETQRNPSWGLDRIDQATLPLDRAFSYAFTGNGVEAYVLDTGIMIEHDEFRGNARCGANFVPNENCETTRGHGTHVAGIIGGANYGVAKDVTLVSLKIFPSGGGGSYTSWIVGALDFVQKQKDQRPTTPMVVNMSFGGGQSSAINNAASALSEAGIFVVASAGNQNDDACNYSPGSASGVVTVGSTESDDSRSGFSNFGSCVDIFAPGGNIPSAWISSRSSIVNLSGTSMSAPMVAGVAALYLERSRRLRPEQLWISMRNDAVVGAVRNSSGSPNRLLNVGRLNLNLPVPPTKSPTREPTLSPTAQPTISTVPSPHPTPQPTMKPSISLAPTVSASPSADPTVSMAPSNFPCKRFVMRCEYDFQCCSERCLDRLGRCFLF